MALQRLSPMVEPVSIRILGQSICVRADFGALSDLTRRAAGKDYIVGLAEILPARVFGPACLANIPETDFKLFCSTMQRESPWSSSSS